MGLHSGIKSPILVVTGVAGRPLFPAPTAAAAFSSQPTESAGLRRGLRSRFTELERQVHRREMQPSPRLRVFETKRIKSLFALPDSYLLPFPRCSAFDRAAGPGLVVNLGLFFGPAQRGIVRP